jgi:hypothetical protein
VVPSVADTPGDLRLVLRGVGGHYHGRSITLERPRLVGRAAEADIRIDNQAFPERHARLEHHDGRVLLRDLDSGESSAVNGKPVRDALLLPGDQVVFDAQHRFGQRRRSGAEVVGTRHRNSCWGIASAKYAAAQQPDAAVPG